MGQFIMQKLVDDRGLSDDFYIDSAALTTEEIGNDIYPPAKRKLDEKGIPYSRHSARKVRKDEYKDWDVFLLMDRSNEREIQWIFSEDPKHKIHRVLENDIIDDPWYTGDFEITYQKLVKGCQFWLDHFTKK